MQRVRPAKPKVKPPAARVAWLARHRRHRLSGPRRGEVLPRRDHVLRLTYLAGGGWLLLLLLLVMLGALPVDAGPRHLAAVAAGAFVGWLAGRAQAKWLWRGEMPSYIWASYCALGWAAGTGLLSAIYDLNHPGGPGGGLSDVGYAFALVICGAVAGLASGAQQAGVLRGHGVDSGWWIVASTCATSIGWSVWAILALTMT